MIIDPLRAFGILLVCLVVSCGSVSSEGLEPNETHYQTYLKAKTACERGDLLVAQEYLRPLVAPESSLSEDDPLTIMSLELLGKVYLARGATEDAVPLYREIIVRRERTKAGLELTAEAFVNLAVAFRRVGRADEAESNFLQALSIRRKLLGGQLTRDSAPNSGLENDRQEAHSLATDKTRPYVREGSIDSNYFSFAASALRDPEKSVGFYTMDLIDREREICPNYSGIARTLIALAAAERAIGHDRSAKRILQKAARVCEQTNNKSILGEIDIAPGLQKK